MRRRPTAPGRDKTSIDRLPHRGVSVLEMRRVRKDGAQWFGRQCLMANRVKLSFCPRCDLCTTGHDDQVRFNGCAAWLCEPERSNASSSMDTASALVAIRSPPTSPSSQTADRSYPHRIESTHFPAEKMRGSPKVRLVRSKGFECLQVELRLHCFDISLWEVAHAGRIKSRTPKGDALAREPSDFSRDVQARPLV